MFEFSRLETRLQKKRLQMRSPGKKACLAGSCLQGGEFRWRSDRCHLDPKQPRQAGDRHKRCMKTCMFILSKFCCARDAGRATLRASLSMHCIDVSRDVRRQSIVASKDTVVLIEEH